MLCSTAVFSLGERMCNTYLRVGFYLHGHNRSAFPPGVVPTTINGTIRLESEFNVRFSSLFNSYIHHFDISGSWIAIHAQHAPGNHSHVGLPSHSFSCIHILIIIWTDGFPADQQLMSDSFAAAFFKVGLLGQPTIIMVSNQRCIVKVYPWH